MLEKWKSVFDKGKFLGALLTDLSKACDCLSHELLLAYGFSLSSLKLIYSYLRNRKQRTINRFNYSSWEEILFTVPQGLILGLLLFNIFLCYIFFSKNETDFASYADNNTPCLTCYSTEDIINLIENNSIKLFK